MIRTIKYSIWCLMLLACQSIDKASEPKVLIGEDRMVEILTDIAFVKAAKSSNRKVFEQKKINPEKYILNKYGIDSIVFAENNTWYAGQLEKYEEIFKRVKGNLEKSRDAFEKLKKEEDSIKKVEDSILKSKDTLQDKDKLIIPSELKPIEEDIEKAKQKRLKPRLKKQ
ncbi:DUF4296 domain-containing protein [Aquimarina mytili]|uniref:DUF4296 domain-containing protein n=1 Tax=Aquimarina mytili TaxID=874423 RepID=A0A936ZTZ3_9FLAO|nr:DUF4296 domain-containing protein [Aquimarina mytili]MBL0681990.1 DUF4296 domain-containing protein [Aquimarina mytili]